MRLVGPALSWSFARSPRRLSTSTPGTPVQEAVGQTPRSQRVRVRFGATLAANLVRIGTTLVGGLVVAKGLGASRFGDLSFLVSGFAAINAVLDMGTSHAFYTFISRRQRSRRFFAFYLAWTLGIQFGISLLLLGLLFPDAWIQDLWVHQPRSLVLMAFAATFMQTQVWMTVVYLGEARRKTVKVQTALALQSVAHVVAVTVLWLAGWLTVQAVLLLLAAEFALLTLALGHRLLKENLIDSEEPDQPSEVIRDFVTYCRPLVLYGVVGFAYSFGDRWLLQKFGGSAQQGIFSVGQQFATVSLVATLSMLNVFGKEIAEGLERNDSSRIEHLYVTVRRALYFLAACVSCLLIPYSREILVYTVGQSYSSGWFALSLMLINPILQSLGQIQGTFFFASKETVRYARVGIIMMALGIPLAVVLLAPKTFPIPGLSLGAAGLAAKLLIVQVVWVAILAYMLKKSHGLKTDYGHQLGILVALLALSLLSKWASDQCSAALGIGQALPLGAVLYVLVIAAVLYRSPQIAGFSHDHVAQALGFLRSVKQRTGRDPLRNPGGSLG